MRSAPCGSSRRYASSVSKKRLASIRPRETPQRETTPFYPRSPYGVAKLYGYWITVNYREAYGMFACNGILFNHESPIRGETFVTRKITRAAVRIALGLQKRLFLGNLDAKRDWGHARDYVRAMYLMLQQEEPDDFVIATGRTTAVRDFVIMAFNELGITLEFTGTGLREEGCVVSVDEARLSATGGMVGAVKTGDVVVSVDPAYHRPTEVDFLVGDASKAWEKLGWRPEHTLEDLVKEMVAADMAEARRDELLKRHHYRIRPNLGE